MGNAKISIILLSHHLSKSIRGCAHLSIEEHGIYGTGVPGRSVNAHLMFTFSVSTPFTPPGKIGWLSIQRSDSTKNHMSSYKHMYGLNYGGDSGYEVLINGSGGQCQNLHHPAVSPSKQIYSWLRTFEQRRAWDLPYWSTRKVR